MNVETETEAALFPEKEYISIVAVQTDVKLLSPSLIFFTFYL